MRKHIEIEPGVTIYHAAAVSATRAYIAKYLAVHKELPQMIIFGYPLLHDMLDTPSQMCYSGKNFQLEIEYTMLNNANVITTPILLAFTAVYNHPWPLLLAFNNENNFSFREEPIQ